MRDVALRMQEEVSRVVQMLTEDAQALEVDQLKTFVQNTVNSLGDLYVSHIANAPVAAAAAAAAAAADTVFLNSTQKITLNEVSIICALLQL